MIKYVDCAVFAAHLPPGFRLAIRLIFIKLLLKRREFRSKIANISQPLDEYELEHKCECHR